MQSTVTSRRSAASGPRVQAAVRPADQAVTDYFRCPSAMVKILTPHDLSEAEGYFSFRGVVGFGRIAGATPSPLMTGAANVPDVSSAAAEGPGVVRLPFDLMAVVRNLREERYRQPVRHPLRRMASSLAHNFYYSIRPMLPVSVRKHLQRLRLSGWDNIAFPTWPVDATVDDLMRQALASVLRASGRRRIPFIWFWPEGAPACAIVTHDVEGSIGRNYCESLMDLNASFGVDASYQLVPEGRDSFSPAVIAALRQRGQEVNVHDWNHDGYLFRSRNVFTTRVARINAWARETGCRGFRSGAMYREQQWFDAFRFSYDMSVPSAAHLEPQRGGCCTVMPYFVGGVVELPLTTIQDYSLFHILHDYSTTLWQQQIEQIVSKNGLITVLTHPDYLVDDRAREVYAELLAQLARMRAEGELWMPLPGDVDRWWRNRARMRHVPDGDDWSITGPDSHRARVAYASLDGDRVVYSVAGRS